MRASERKASIRELSLLSGQDSLWWCTVIWTDSTSGLATPLLHSARYSIPSITECFLDFSGGGAVFVFPFLKATFQLRRWICVFKVSSACCIENQLAVLWDEHSICVRCAVAPVLSGYLPPTSVTCLALSLCARLSVVHVGCTLRVQRRLQTSRPAHGCDLGHMSERNPHYWPPRPESPTRCPHGWPLMRAASEAPVQRFEGALAIRL